MSAAKILWGQILAVLIIIVASVWSATQWTASQLGFQPELGAPWFRLFDHPVYRPYDLFWWWFSFDAYAPQITTLARSIRSCRCFRTSWVNGARSA